MKTSAISFDDLSRSVIAVPPLARNPNLSAATEPNRQIIRHLHQGGVTSLMYGGNANFQNLPVSSFADTLEMLVEAADEEAWIIPAAGPDFGRITDQIPALRAMRFPTAMMLPPYAGSYSPAGLVSALKRFSDGLQAPVLFYAKHNECIDPRELRRLVDDGIVGWIKYSVVRSDPADDPFLRAILDEIDPRRVISGIGERPAIVHFRQFGLTSFTSGSVCVAPRTSMALLAALQAGDDERAEAIRKVFLPLEDCRDCLGPPRVLHDAIDLARIAETGPIAPLQSNLNDEEARQVGAAAKALLATEDRLLAA